MTREELEDCLRYWDQMGCHCCGYYDVNVYDRACLPSKGQLKGGDSVSHWYTANLLDFARFFEEVADAIRENVDWDILNDEESCEDGIGWRTRPVYFRRADDKT